MREATQRLLELGFSDKEAQVYLALLELGPSAVNEIAKKSGVNRSTTYLSLEALMKRGLASGVVRDKKVFYAAESPERLDALLSKEKELIEERRKKLEDAIPTFMALFNAVEDKPVVRFFEGEEGIALSRDELMRSSGEFLSFTAVDEGTIRVAHVDETQRLRMSRRMRGKVILALKPGCMVPKMDLKYWEVREIPFESSPFTGEINIVDDKVAAIVVKAKPISFLVRSREMSDLFRALFFSAWRVATPVDKRKYENGNAPKG
jgi:sugar-specific transcriptional regulator TrmB